MIGWLIVLLLLTGFLFIKTGLWLRWESGQTLLKVRIGVFRFSLSTKRKKKEPKNGKSKPDKTQNKDGKASTKKWIVSLLGHWKDALDLVIRVLKTPKADLLRLRIAAGGADPEVCAMNYGRYCAALGAALPIVQSALSVKKQDIDVSCQFDRKETDVLAEIEMTVRVYEILGLLCRGTAFLLKLYRHTNNSNKAVQV